MKLHNSVLIWSSVVAIIAAFYGSVTLRLKFKRELLGNVQLMTRNGEFYIFAQTYNSTWRPTPVEYLRTTITGFALMPPPHRDTERLHVVHGRGDEPARIATHEIESSYGSAFALSDRIYFFYGARESHHASAVFQVLESELRVPSPETNQHLLSSVGYASEETKAAGWASEEMYEIRGYREMEVRGNPYILRVLRDRNRYDLELKSTNDGRTVFQLRGTG